MACGTGKTLVARFLHDEIGVATDAGAGAVAFAVEADDSRVVRGRRLRLSRGLLRRHGRARTRDAVVSIDERTRGARHDRPDRDRGVPARARAAAGRVRDLSVVAADRRRAGGRDAARSTSWSPTRRTVAPGREAGVFATVLDPAKIKATQAALHDRDAALLHRAGEDGRRARRTGRSPRWTTSRSSARCCTGSRSRRPSSRSCSPTTRSSSSASATHYREMARAGAFVTTDGETVTDARTLASQIGLLRAMRTTTSVGSSASTPASRNASGFATSLLDVARWMPVRRRPTGRLWARACLRGDDQR